MMDQTQFRMNAEAKGLIKEAADFVGLTLSAFIRLAALEKARAVLALEPKIPVYRAGATLPTSERKRGE